MHGFLTMGVGDRHCAVARTGCRQSPEVHHAANQGNFPGALSNSYVEGTGVTQRDNMRDQHCNSGSVVHVNILYYCICE